MAGDYVFRRPWRFQRRPIYVPPVFVPPPPVQPSYRAYDHKRTWIVQLRSESDRDRRFYQRYRWNRIPITIEGPPVQPSLRVSPHKRTWIVQHPTEFDADRRFYDRYKWNRIPITIEGPAPPVVSPVLRLHIHRVHRPSNFADIDRHFYHRPTRYAFPVGALAPPTGFIPTVTII